MLEVLFRLVVAGSLMMGSAHLPLLAAHPSPSRTAMPDEGRMPVSPSHPLSADARKA